MADTFSRPTSGPVHPSPTDTRASPPTAMNTTTDTANEFDVTDLADAFGLPDLATQLAAVDELILTTLSEGEALLGPASIRVASTGGKRLRPLLTLACAAVNDVFDDKVLAAAAAVELVQVGSLVHDDILDQADSRRGQPTINAAEGLNHAVLAGDYMLARAAELAASVSGEAAQLLARTISELCEGQVLELRNSYDPDLSADAHFAAIRGKTAALFECACRLGGLCAELPPASTAALGRYGDAFGMGFQLLDDVLDLVGNPDRLGKPIGVDLDSGVYTLPVLSTLGGPGGDALRAVLPDPATGRAGDTATALGLVRASGNIEGSLAALDRYADTARQAVAHLDQTTVGEGLANFPRTYYGWALDHLTDGDLLDVVAS